MRQHNSKLYLSVPLRLPWWAYYRQQFPSVANLVARLSMPGTSSMKTQFSSLVNKTKLTIPRPRPRPNVSDQDQDQDQCFTRPRPDQDQNFKTKTKTNCPVSQNPNIIHSSILVSKVILLNDWQRWRYVLNVIKSFKNLLYLTVRSTIYMTNGIQTV